MTIYKNKMQETGLVSLESVPAAGGQHLVFHMRDAKAADDLKQTLSGAAVPLQWVAQTSLNGQPLLIAQSTHNAEKTVLETLRAQGNDLSETRKQKKIDPWVIRSSLGVGGQLLQLTSSFLRPEKPGAAKGFWHKVDLPIFVFAAANLTASAIGLIYKGQTVDDPHQLRYLKQQVNDKLSPEMQAGHIAPSVDDNRSQFREKSKQDTGLLGGFNAFMRKYSVNIGELGLRYLAAFGLVSPMNSWANPLKGKMPELSQSSYRVAGGGISLIGKTMALGSEIPDPYNPKPKSWLDGVREKYTFLAGGIVEAGAFSLLAYENFFKTKPLANGTPNPRSIVINGKAYRDWLGGIGASMFVTGYIVRSWAKYGERHVNMDELYAHISDTLAQLPPEKIPQLLADTTADIKTHFKGADDLDFGTIYTALTNDLKRYHQIDVAQLQAAGLQVAPQPEAAAATPPVAPEITAPQASPANKVQAQSLEHHMMAQAMPAINLTH